MEMKARADRVVRAKAGQRRPAKGRTEASSQRQDRGVLPYGVER